ncbi:MAG: hypothetical protein BGN87_10260 [Rhizobiales bacterium 65-79]|jgi:hypothetical protein|nr:MAG: hypothetical protein BGN87_10260 [Rhizobiales bacterium 65-79]
MRLHFMKKLNFKTPVIVDLGSGADRDVGSVGEALDILSADWPPEKRGAAHAEAVRACRAALAGELAPEKARDAFSGAAWEAEFFVSDLRRLSDEAA